MTTAVVRTKKNRMFFLSGAISTNPDSIRHENTKTSRTAREAENELTSSLNAIAKNIESESNVVNYPQLQQKYNQQVQLTIQSAIQKIYLAGTDYATEFHGVPTVLTQQDLANIQDETTQRVNQFWRAMDRVTMRQQFDVQKPELNRAAMMQSLATVASTSTLATATISKSGEVDPEGEVVWVTSIDDKVCVICRPLQGKTWKINDPTLLYPPDSTHPNCRCRLLLKDSGEIFSR